MKAVVHSGGGSPQQRAPRQDAGTTGRDVTHAIKVEPSGRVRLSEEREVRGKYCGSDFIVTTTRYLDGTVRQVSQSGSYREEDVRMEAVPSRTRDITDYGRLTIAAKRLTQSMATYGPDNPPSPEQITTFVMGYQNLQEWRRQAQEKMTRAEGEIDVVEQVLTRFM
jgi:hypothetical protein